MKKRSILTAIALILILTMTACSGKTKEAGTADSKETVQESTAEEGSAAEEAVEAEPAEEPAEAVPVEEPAEAEPAEEPAEAVPAEPAAASVTIDHPDRGITYEISYPSEGVEVSETQVFGDPGYTFKSESEGCYITVYSSGMYTSDIQSRLDKYDNVTYGDHKGWYEYTSYAAEGFMVGPDNGEGLSRLLAFKVGNYEESPAEHADIDGFLQSNLVTFVLTSYQVSGGEASEAAGEAAEPEEQPVVVDGVAHLEKADIVIPEGWTVVKEASSNIKLERDEKMPPRVEGDDPLTATMTIIASSKIHGTAAESIETANSNFGGGNEIMTGNYNGSDWVYICPVEDQFYMYTDASDGNYVQIDGMFMPMNEEIEAFLNGITVK